MSKYKYSDEMNEISGFGGGYEEVCRKMVVSGVEWLEKHKTKDPKATQNPQIFGILFDKNEDMDELHDAMMEDLDESPTGAMVQACTNHVLYIQKNGWDKYVDEMTKDEAV